MQRNGWLGAAVWCVLVSIGAAAASAQGAGSQGSADTVRLPPPTVVYSGTRELNWTIRVPLLTIEQREFAFRTPTGITRPQRWDYDGPAVRTERRKIAVYPDFSCKYLDWTISNECRTVWRGIYADLPVVVTRPQHLVFDMPDWRWKTQLVPIAVPRWTWKEERWSVSVPVLVTTPPDDVGGPPGDEPAAKADFERVRAALAAKQASSLAVLDGGLRALDRSIAAVEAYGGDPRRIEAEDGSTLDLAAARTALRDERAYAARSFRRIGEELEAANSSRASRE